MAEPWTVEPAAEGTHQPDGEPWWNESWYVDFVDPLTALAGFARIGLHPNQGTCWWTAGLVLPDGTAISSVDTTLPVPAGRRLPAVAEAQLSAAFTVDEPLRSAHLVADAPARVHPDPAAAYRGAPGVPTSIGLDLSWRTDGVPYGYGTGTRYEVPCTVAGTVRIGGVDHRVDGHGQRDHSWGVRDWWSLSWSWFAARLDGGTRIHGVDVRLGDDLHVPFGYVQDRGRVQPITRHLAIAEQIGDDHLPMAATVTSDEVDLDVRVVPLGVVPLEFIEADRTRLARLPRALARFEARSGDTGLGWIEWNTVARGPAGSPR